MLKLFKSKSAIKIAALEERVAALELVNQQRFELWEAKQKRYKNNKNKKVNV